MCGIGGIYQLDGRVLEQRLLELMVGRMVHRGPDGDGVFQSRQIGLSHNRLKIIDLSDQANQPMTDPKASVR